MPFRPGIGSCPRPLALVRGASVLAVAVATLAAAAPGSATGASSSVVVTLDVVSSTTLDASACATGTTNVTVLGTMQPGDGRVLGDCSVQFGSSNDQGMLLLSQVDGVGAGMWRLPHGVEDVDSGDGDHFSTDGIINFDLGANDEAEAVVVQRAGANAGKAVTAGWEVVGGNERVVLTRTNLDGSPDAGFGPGGVRSYDLDPLRDDRGEDLALGPNDELYVAIIHDNASGDEDAGVLKLSPDGVLDATFSAGDGTDGWDTYDSGGDDNVRTIVVDDAGRTTIAAYSTVGTVPSTLVRYLPGGARDPSFGAGGVATFDPTASGDSINDLAIQPSSGLLVGAGDTNHPPHRIWAVRLLDDGTPDPTFGTDDAGTVGYYELPDLGNALNRSLAMHADGSFVLVNEAPGTPAELLVAGFDADGNLDTTGFGTAGLLQSPIGADVLTVRRAASDPAGNTYVAVRAMDPTLDADMGVVRITPDGRLDGTFGTNGLALPDLTSSVHANDVAIGPDGKPVLAGYGVNRHAIIRLDTVRMPDYDDAGGDDWTTDDAALFGVCLRDVADALLDGSTWSRDTVDGDCADGDADPWRAVPAQADASAKVAEADAVGEELAFAHLRFGARLAPDALPGRYVAPIEFTVLAPAT